MSRCPGGRLLHGPRQLEPGRRLEAHDESRPPRIALCITGVVRYAIVWHSVSNIPYDSSVISRYAQHPLRGFTQPGSRPPRRLPAMVRHRQHPAGSPGTRDGARGVLHHALLCSASGLARGSASEGVAYGEVETSCDSLI